MQAIRWTIQQESAPAILRGCPRCGQSHHVQSGKFRINANGARLDVWLVYNCTGCGKSFNLPLFERVRPAALQKKGLYGRLLANDKQLAREFASSTPLLRANHLQAVLVEQALCVDAPPLPTVGICRLVLHNQTGCAVRTERVLAQGLGISRAAVEMLAKRGAVRVLPASKAKLPKLAAGGELALLVDTDAL